MSEIQVNLPQDVANMSLPAPELVTYYRNAENRTFWVDFDVDESLLEFCRQVLFINKQDEDISPDQRKPIKLFIFSNGGMLDPCFSAVDVMLMSKTPIITINAGLAMSAGMLLFLSGSERIVLRHSQGLIHSGSGGAVGTYEQAEESMKNYRRSVEAMRELVLERTSIDQKLFNKNKSKDWYLSADEMLKYGVATKIATSIDEVL